MIKLHIIDTNILCCYLKIPGKDTLKDWDIKKIEEKIEDISIKEEGIVIPLPMMIEIGNHIGHLQHRESYLRLSELIKKTIDLEAPFHAFNEQKIFWEGKSILHIVEEWEKHLYTTKVGLGDILILALASYFKTNLSGRRYDVDIWSADNDVNLLREIDFFSEKLEPKKETKKTRVSRN